MPSQRSVIARLFALALVLGLTFAGSMVFHSPALARTEYRAAFLAEYPSAVGTRLDDLVSAPDHCGTCHYNFAGGGTLNPYGVAVRDKLDDYPNDESGWRAAILWVQYFDSDADGHTSVVEITRDDLFPNVPTFPGLSFANVSLVSNVDVNEILPYLEPSAGSPPSITLLSPNGNEVLQGTGTHLVTWTATDDVEVTAIDLFYRDSESAAWTPIELGLTNSGSYLWPVPLVPTNAARLRAIAHDGVGQTAADQSDALFSIYRPLIGLVPTTLRDFHEPGTQPFGGGTFENHVYCAICHGNYNPDVEPVYNFEGSMMSQAARDPLFFACLAVAEQDAPGSGDLCLRCHTPVGWLGGDSNPTDGSAITADDRDGVNCHICHRLVDPIYESGVSPVEDQAILAALPLEDRPVDLASGMYVLDPVDRRRGPYQSTTAPHPYLYSPFHRSSDLCGTCHDVSNPVYTRTGDRDYAPNPMDTRSDAFDSTTLFPLERTYSEWKNSTFNTLQGVYAPEFAGNKPGGHVSTCQDCHMRDVSGRGCNSGQTRSDLGLHDLQGGNYWMGPVIASIYPTEVNAEALNDGAARAVAMLKKAALLDVAVAPEGDSVRAEVTVTNRSGHKLPSGYPEGRRMWLHVVARDAANAVVYESGRYVSETGELMVDSDITVYEAKLGISPAIAEITNLASGESFHFALNDTLIKDNRIPPLGFNNSVYAAFGGQPLESDHPEPRYPDGQNWDVARYSLPASARHVAATLYYQTTSKDYIEFLQAANVTNSKGQEMYALWTANGRAAPVAMVKDSLDFVPSDVAALDPPENEIAISAGPNPTRDSVLLRLSLPRPTTVTVDIFDLGGRLVWRSERRMLSAGAHTLEWLGVDEAQRDVGSGVFFARLRADSKEVTRRIVRLARP